MLAPASTPDSPTGSACFEELTPREREILDLMAAGTTNIGIARRLVISERTVETHVRRIMQKLCPPRDDEIDRRILAVALYLQQGSGETANRPATGPRLVVGHSGGRASTRERRVQAAAA